MSIITNKEGRNLEEINKNRILKFGTLSYRQSQGVDFYKLSIGRDEAFIKCERCNEGMTVKWKEDDEWHMKDGWKVYLKKSQVKKSDHGYYINSSIQFYCSKCDLKHNHWEEEGKY